VRKFCRARALGLADSLPAARVKRAPENVTLAAAALLDARGRTLLVRPRATEAALFSRMWQFPAANVSADALSATRRSAGAKEISALRAELAKHLRVSLGIVGIKAALLERADDSRHTVTFRRIRLATFLARVARLPRLANARTPLLRDVTRLAVSSATKKIAAAALRAVSAAPPAKT
jgi:adenine-specific DNA glycosylase